MAKILMIQIQNAPYAGTAYLNGTTKSHNHQFVLLLSSNPIEIKKRIHRENPDLIGFSCMSSFYKEIIELTTKIKKYYPSIPIILGGPHPTLFPEVLNEKSIDIICRGEGEFALIDLLNSIDHKTSNLHIDNLYVKLNKKIYKNKLRPLVEPLDNIPLIDWSCYHNTTVLNSPPIVFLIRGCPYSCTYCFNESTRNLYKGLGPYLRHFSIQRSLLEIKEALRYFSHSPVLFTSDSFGTDLEWMDKLFTEYNKITDLPFVLLLRPELTTEKCVDILAKHKCYSVAIGVESGSERVRKEILNRHYSNQLLFDVAQRLHNKKIKFRTYNMIGLPTETEKELWETIETNIKMKTDFPRTSIFTPFPNTKIVDLAIKNGYLSSDFSFKDLPETILSRSILKKLDQEKIQITLYFFQSAIIFPRLKPIFKWLTNLKPNFLFRSWFYFIYAYLHQKSEQSNPVNYFFYLIANSRYK